MGQPAQSEQADQVMERVEKHSETDEQEESKQTQEEEKKGEEDDDSSSSDDEDYSSSSDSEEEEKESKTEAFKFGFEMKYSNLIPESFFAPGDEMPLLEFNPERIPPAQRQIEKFRIEMERFDEERYANDNYD